VQFEMDKKKKRCEGAPKRNCDANLIMDGGEKENKTTNQESKVPTSQITRREKQVTVF